MKRFPPSNRDDDAAWAYSLAEVGTRLGVSADTVARMIAAGHLPVVVVWGKRRVTHQALLTYIYRDSHMTLSATGRRRLASVAGGEA
jgi:excisionase family DNA binding protein